MGPATHKLDDMNGWAALNSPPLARNSDLVPRHKVQSVLDTFMCLAVQVLYA